MSKSKLRVENNCLNCNAEVTGRFCSICGQENLVPQESVWDLISHFFKDLTHFDRKHFNSLKYLIFKHPVYLNAFFRNIKYKNE